MFSGLISRWTSPIPCASSSDAHTWRRVWITLASPRGELSAISSSRRLGRLRNVVKTDLRHIVALENVASGEEDNVPSQCQRFRRPRSWLALPGLKLSFAIPPRVRATNLQRCDDSNYELPYSGPTLRSSRRRFLVGRPWILRDTEELASRDRSRCYSRVSPKAAREASKRGQNRSASHCRPRKRGFR